MTQPLTHYDVLGVSESARREEISRAFQRKMREVHPDLGGTTAQASLVTDAHATLKDPALRAEYDASLVAPPVEDDEPDWGFSADEEIVDDWGSEVAADEPVESPLDSEEVDDGWGTELPLNEPPLKPVDQRGRRPLDQIPLWPWESGYAAPPKQQQPRPWHLFWLMGHGGLVILARVLSCILLALFATPILWPFVEALIKGKADGVSLSGVLSGVFVAALWFAPLVRRAFGRGIHWEYVLFVLILIALPLFMIWMNPSGSSSATWSYVVIASFSTVSVVVAELRSFLINSGRARV